MTHSATQNQKNNKANNKALVIGCGGIVGGAWTVAMLDAYCQITGEQATDFDIIMGTSAGAVLAALLGGGMSIKQLAEAQEREKVHLAKGTWQHGGALPQLPKLNELHFPTLKMLRHGLRADIPMMTKLSALLPSGIESLDTTMEMLSEVKTQTGWVSHPNTWVVGLNTQTAARTVFGSQTAPNTDIETAVRASYAVPGWCPYVHIAGDVYMDGGAFSPASADLLLSQPEADVQEAVIITPMTYSHETRLQESQRSNTYRQPLTMLERVLRKQMTKQLIKEVKLLKAAGIKVTQIQPTLADLDAFGHNMMDPARRLTAYHTAKGHALDTVNAALYGC